MYRRRYRRKAPSRRRTSYTGRKRKRLFRKGYDRVGGFYGRFGVKNKKSKTEKKFYDSVILLADIDVLGTYANYTTPPVHAGPVGDTASLVDIPQGTGESERIGRRCTITNILMTLCFTTTADNSPDLNVANETDEIIRTMVFWDKQCNGQPVLATDLLARDEYNSYRNLANQQRFSILYDKTKTYYSGALAAGPGPLATDVLSILTEKDYVQKVNIKCFIPIEYEGDTGGLSTIKTNNIGMFFWAKHGDRINITKSWIRVRMIDL